MNVTIKLTLVKEQIFESVKNETFLRGQVEKAADQKAITMAYHEQAGDETYQNRLLDRAFYTNVEELKTHLSDYLSSKGWWSADNLISSDVDEDNGNVVIYLSVSDRFNKGYTNSLAKLCAKYVEETMLMDWWKPINEKQAALYERYVERDLTAIKRCFNKTAPTPPVASYPTALNIQGTAIDLAIDETATITYSIPDGEIDDIGIDVADTTLCEVGKSEDGFTVKGLKRGHTIAQLASRHNDDLTKTIHIYITTHT
jgi:hypothetical protein